MALVHTGSRLANGDCGTKISVFAAPPIAGRAKVQAGSPPVPEQTVASVKEDVRETKQKAKEGRA